MQEMASKRHISQNFSLGSMTLDPLRALVGAAMPLHKLPFSLDRVGISVKGRWSNLKTFSKD